MTPDDLRRAEKRLPLADSDLADRPNVRILLINHEARIAQLEEIAAAREYPCQDTFTDVDDAALGANCETPDSVRALEHVRDTIAGLRAGMERLARENAHLRKSQSADMQKIKHERDRASNEVARLRDLDELFARHMARMLRENETVVADLRDACIACVRADRAQTYCVPTTHSGGDDEIERDEDDVGVLVDRVLAERALAEPREKHIVDVMAEAGDAGSKVAHVGAAHRFGIFGDPPPADAFVTLDGRRRHLFGAPPPAEEKTAEEERGHRTNGARRRAREDAVKDKVRKKETP